MVPKSHRVLIIAWALLFWFIPCLHPVMDLFKRGVVIFDEPNDSQPVGEKGWDDAFSKWWRMPIFIAIFMSFVFGEGYRVLHGHFAPMVVRRTIALSQCSVPSRQRTIAFIFAPFFVAGFFHATKGRLIRQWAVIIGVPLLVIGVIQLPYPYRQFIDISVSIGLVMGLMSGIFNWELYYKHGITPFADAEFPEGSPFAALTDDTPICDH